MDDQTVVQSNVSSNAGGLPVTIPVVVVVSESGVQAAAKPIAVPAARRPVPLPRTKKINESINPTEDEYVDPRVFTRDRVLSIVLMEEDAVPGGAMGGAKDREMGVATGEEEDLYVAMQHTSEAPPTERTGAPASPKYANVGQWQRNSYMGQMPHPSGREREEEGEEEYVQMMPGLQTQLRRSTDPNISARHPSPRGGSNLSGHKTDGEGSSLLEEVLSSSLLREKDKVPFCLPNKHFEGHSIEGEEDLYYNFT